MVAHRSRSDGTGLTKLFDSLRPIEHPVWSPDGSRIAYTVWRDGPSNPPSIVVSNADGSGDGVFTGHPAGDFAPDWQALPIDIAPSSVTVRKGTLRSGDASSLGADDGAYLTVSAKGTRARAVNWYATFTGVSNSARGLIAVYVGASTRECNQVLSIFRRTDLKWVRLDKREVSPIETTVSKAVAGTPEPFVRGPSGPGDVRLRVTCKRADALDFDSLGELMAVRFFPG